MTVEELLRELEPLTYDGRVRRMVGIGRESRENADTARLLNTLEQGDFYTRWMAMLACYGSRDGAKVLRGLDDPSRSVRGLAVRLVPLACDDAQIGQALAGASQKRQKTLLVSLSKRNRRVPIDTFLRSLAASGDDRLPRLLSVGSPELVASLALAIFADPQSQTGSGANDWNALARRHPAVAADSLTAQIETLSPDAPNPRILWAANAALSAIADRLPDRALTLVQELARHYPLAQIQFGRLADRRADAVADLVLAQSAKGARIDFDRAARQLDAARWIGLMTRRIASPGPKAIQRLAPETRAEIFRATSVWNRTDEGVSLWPIGLLPRELREAEARQHLGLPALSTRPQIRLAYAAFLPWDEARQTLMPFLGDPDPNLRIAAWHSLCGAARFHRDRLGELLTLILARKNEQDPVRGAFLAAIAVLPPGRWQPEHLEALGQIIRAALDAADLSTTSAAAAQYLVVALLPFHPAWSVEWFAVLAKERGSIGYGSMAILVPSYVLYNHAPTYTRDAMESRLTNADVRRIAPIFLPVLSAWETRERVGQIIAFAGALGRRLKAFDGLCEILENVVRSSWAQWASVSALNLLSKHRPDRMKTLVPALLARDRSWATQEPVYTFLHRKRQDLLTPFLGRTAHKGRFSRGRTRFALPLASGFHRWTAAQQTTFSQTLTELTQDEMRDSPTVYQAINQLAALPDSAPTRLLEMAQRSYRPRGVREAALRALGQLDGGQGVPVLLEAMDDDRARIAIYALRSALLEMPAPIALTALQSVPLDRVTVAKEVVRLLGELRTDEAYRAMLAIAASRGETLHRDVRVALLRGLWEHLERNETWTILEQAAASPDPAIVTHLARIPADRLSAQAQRRVVGLLATLLTHPDATVRTTILTRLVSLPVADREGLMRPGIAISLRSAIPDERTAAGQALFATYAARDLAFLRQTITELLPNRRALQSCIQTFTGHIYREWARSLVASRAVLDILESDPHTITLQLSVAILSLPWSELTAFLAQKVTTRQLHADALNAAKLYLRSEIRFRADFAQISELENALVASDDRYLRRLALACLVAESGAFGWNDDRRARLETYRADPAAIVAEAAQFTFPPDTDERGMEESETVTEPDDV